MELVILNMEKVRYDYFIQIFDVYDPLKLGLGKPKNRINQNHSKTAQDSKRRTHNKKELQHTLHFPFWITT